MARLISPEVFRNRFPFWLLLPVIVWVCGSGCVIIEKKTLVVDLADTTQEIRVLYLYEGISVSEEHRNQEINRVPKPQVLPFPFHFVTEGKVQKTGSVSGDRLAELFFAHTKIEDLTYYTDPSRMRPLCAEQRVTIGHRDEIIEALNGLFQEFLKQSAKEPTEKLMVELNEQRTDEGKRLLEAQEENLRKQLQQFGLGSFSVFPRFVLAFQPHGDEAWINHAKEAIASDHVWFRRTPGGIEFVIPATADCARRVVDDENTKRSLEEMRRVVSPVRVEARADGIVIILGTEDKALTCTLEDKRPHAPGHEADLIEAAGGDDLLKLRGLHRDGLARIDQFLRRSSTLRRIWKSSNGRFQVEATLEEFKDEVATLKRIDDGRLIEVKLEQLHADDKAWLNSEADRTRRLPTLEDKRPPAPGHEAELPKAAGGDGLLTLIHDGLSGINQLLRRSSAHSRIWKSRDGRFEMEATLEKFKDGVATLKRIDDGRLIEVKLEQLHADDKAWLNSVADRTRRLPTLEKKGLERPKAKPSR